MGSLRSFTFNNADLGFILTQVEFRPLFIKDANGRLIAAIGYAGTVPIYDQTGDLLFDPAAQYSANQLATMAKSALAPFGQMYDAQGNPVMNWNGTGAVYDAHGTLIWDGAPAFAGTAQQPAALTAAQAAALFGSSYGSANTGSGVTDFAGLRNVSGLFNNLNPGQAHWGQVDGLFARTTPVGYGQYLQEKAGAPSTETILSTVSSSVDGPTTSQTISAVVGGATLTFNVFTRTTTTDTYTDTRINNYHLRVNQDDTVLSTVVTTQGFVNGVAGAPAQAGQAAVSEFKSLSGGELDPAYHPQFVATSPADPNYIPNLADRVNLLNDTNYAVTFTTDPTSKAVTINERSVVDYTPRMIAQTVTQGGTPVEYLKAADPTAITHDPLDATSAGGFAYTYKGGTGVVLLRDGLNHNVYWNAKVYSPDLVRIVEADITAGNHDVAYYRTLPPGTVVGQDAHGHNVLWNADAYNYSKPIFDHHIDTSALIEGAAIVDTSVALLAGQADGTGGATSQGDANLYSGAGYGTLSMTGQHDKQNTDANSATGFGNHEYFYGNVASIGGNAPNNGWFALFGQFFDHGLDFVGKSSSYQIVVPLAVDDPLYGVIGPDGRPTTSITINRAIVEGPVQQVDPATGKGMVDAQGNPVYQPAYTNHDSPYIDQSQTYGSQADVDTILRNWVKDPNTGKWHPGDTLVDGHTVAAYTNAFGDRTTATLPTLNDLRAEIRAHGGADVQGPRADLTWEDVSQGLRVRDADGAIAAGAAAGSVEPLLLDMNPHFDKGHLSQAAVDAVNAAIDAAGLAPFGIGHLSFDGNGDLAGNGAHGIGALAPFLNFSDFSIPANLFAAPSGTPAIGAGLHAAIGELMMQSVGDHYVAGDGRANENMGLTAIHHVFHEEHGYQVQNIETYVLGIDAGNLKGADAAHPHATAHDWEVAVAAKTGDVISQYVANVAGHYEVKANVDPKHPQWVVARDVDGNFYVTDAAAPKDGANGKFASLVRDTNGNPVTADGSYTDASGYLSWDQDKMFNAAKLTVEMEYQHMAVDQYARAVSPNIQEFAGYASDKNADISLEFGQAAFRFGHSTLRETIDTMDPTGGITGKIMSYALEQAFLDPALFAKVGPGAVALGMERQLMNEVDNTLTPSLNEGLLGQPLDLGAINIARGRDVGLPTLNQAKTALGLKAYADWADFGQQMVHPEQVANFVAAYSFDGDMTKARTIVDLYSGVKAADLTADEQAYAKTLGASYADQVKAATAFMTGGDRGIDKVDLWIGGLAEQHVAGGVLGETFDTIFVTQIENLMDGDRFYYLQRLVNQQFGNEIQNEQFKDLVERNTGVTNLNGNIFAYADQYYDEGRAAKIATSDLADPTKLGNLYQGSKSDGSWHQVFQVSSDGHSGQWLDAGGNVTSAIPAGAIYDLWGQEVTDLYAADGHKVFDRTTMAWTDAGYDPTTGATAAGRPLYVDLAADPSTGVSPGPADPGFLLSALGADQHKYGQIINAHAGDANSFGNGAARDGVNEAGVTIIDESHNGGIGIWSIGGPSTQANGSIAEHVFTLPLNDGLGGPDGSVSPLVTALNAIGRIDPSVLASDHITVDEKYILDVRPNGETVNKDGSLDVGADSAEVLVGTQFNDYIDMGIGDDTAYGGGGNDIIFGGKSNAGHNSIYGGDGADILVGGDAPDLIEGGRGDDWIWGASSGSSVNGVDQLIGGEGNDHVFGGIGIDKIFGGSGDDFIYGGSDTDPFVFGGDGNDYVNGGSGQDVLNGDNGDDIVDGGPGIDQLFGGSGDDILRAGPGVSAIGGNGGGGDVLVGGDSTVGPNGQSTDDGFDLADYSQQTVDSGIVGDLANQALVSQLPQDKTPLPANVATATTNGDVWFEMEGIVGSKNADVLRGDSAADPSAIVSHGDNWLIGGSGDDVLEGRGGNDVIVGGSIRLDTLVGTYVDPSGQVDPYTSDVDGASHRVSVDASLKGGLLDYASSHGVAGITYADHFTDLMKSGAYRDYAFGDGNPQGGTDVAAYSGAQTDYKVTYMPFTDAHGTLVQAFQIQDLRPGSPDGTDLLVGISKLAFNYNETTGAGTLLNMVDALDAAPTIASVAFSATVAESTATAVTASLNGQSPAGTILGTLSASDALTAGQQALGQSQGNLTWSIANTDALTRSLFKVVDGPTTVNGAAATANATLQLATAPDFEALKAAGATVNAAGQLVFKVDVQVSDGILSAKQTETVLIGNVDEKATGAIHFAGATVTGNTVTFTGSPGDLADPDVTGIPTLTYGLSGTGAPANGLVLTGSPQAGAGVREFHLTGTYAQPVPLGTATVTSPDSAFIGTGGGDVLVGTAGADLLVGLNGNDTYFINNAGDVVVEAPNGGTDTVFASLNAYTLTANVENLTFTGTGDFTGTGNALANVITGGGGNDRFVATVDNARDSYFGGIGSDTVDYSAYTTPLTVNFGTLNPDGTVTVAGSGTGANTDLIGNIENFTGGSGNDTVVAARDNVANVFDGGAGGDTANYSAYAASLRVDFSGTGPVVVTGSGSTVATSDTLRNFENFVGGSGADTVVAATDAVAHRYDGGGGNDTVDFSKGTAAVTVDLGVTGATSQGGTSTVTVQNFENVIGGSGADKVTVGNGTTTFVGNGGADTLVFASLTQIKNGTARDVFADFTAGTDKIDLKAVDANGALGGTPHFAFTDATALWNGNGNEFSAGTANNPTAGQARYHYETVNGVIHTVLDLHTTNAAGGADHQIDLGIGQKIITHTDLVLA